jgi:hypothetical protein
MLVQLYFLAKGSIFSYLRRISLDKYLKGDKFESEERGVKMHLCPSDRTLPQNWPQTHN